MLKLKTYIALEYVILLKNTKEKELLGTFLKDLKFPRLKECTKELLERLDALFRLSKRSYFWLLYQGTI